MIVSQHLSRIRFTLPCQWKTLRVIRAVLDDEKFDTAASVSFVMP